MNRRRWMWLGGGTTAALAVVVGVATNQVLNNDRLSWPWLGGALGIALLTVVLDRRLVAAERPADVHTVRDSELELSNVAITQTGPRHDRRVVLDLKLRNIGDQPAILHHATFHIHDAVSLSPDHLVWFLPYRELWVRGHLQVSHTYQLALPEPEEAVGSRHNLNLSQDIPPAGTDRFHIELGHPPTMDTLIYLLHFDIHYDAQRTATSPAIAIAHPPGSQLASPDEIRQSLHDFRRAIHEVHDAVDREVTDRGLPAPDWDHHPPASRADLPANLRSVDGVGLPCASPGAYEVSDTFWNPQDAITQRLRDIDDYCSRIVAIITEADPSHDSLPQVLTQAQAILTALPAMRAEFSAEALAIRDRRGTADVVDSLSRMLDGPCLEDQRARARGGDHKAAAQMDTAAGRIDTIRRLGACHPAALHARQDLILWLARWDQAGAAAALAALVPDQAGVQGADHPRTLKSRHYLAKCRGETGVAAAAEFVELVADLTRVLGPDHPDTLDGRHLRAWWQASAGDPEGAIETFAELVADHTRLQGRDHPRTLTARHNLAVCRGKAGDPAAATAALAELVTDLTRVLGPDHPDTLRGRHELARWQRQAEPEDASS